MKQREEGQEGVCEVVGKLDRPWKNYKQKAPFCCSPSKLKGQCTGKMSREIQKTWIGNKLILIEHFSSGEKWEHQAEITAQALNLWKCHLGTKQGRRNQKSNWFNFLD